MTSSAFFTDLYEFTMLEAALESDMADKKVVFELFARCLPRGRSYGVVGGVSHALSMVEQFTFTEDQLVFLKNNTQLKDTTLNFFRHFRFSGTISGYRDGELYFGYSPILTVEGTFAECVVIETLLLSVLNHASAVISAASRMVLARNGIKRPVTLIDMGSRRTQENAAVMSALMAYIAGFDATSNVEAGHKYGIPVVGTSAHAFTLLHSSEIEAFENQVKALGEGTTLLVDTYDIKQGIDNAVFVAGKNLGAIRVDSGDLVEETFKARAQLDELGAKNTRIILSSDMDEYSILDLQCAGAPVDGIGVGTRLATGSGAPTASMVYKLVAVEDEHGVMQPVAKKAEGKKSIGGKKFVYRTHDEDGIITGEYFIAEQRATPEVQRTFIEQGVRKEIYTTKEARELHQRRLKELPFTTLSQDTAYIETQQEKKA